MGDLRRETISVRTTKEIKDLLQLIAVSERRSLSSMIEVLILKHAESRMLKVSDREIND